MLEVFPDYYKDFHCIAGACAHSCCVGWEIDIDPEAARRFRALPGPLGDELRAKIAWEDPPHFILEEGDRCPFLNEQNLCRLILEFGEDVLCHICTEHPRFYNDLPGRVEGGVGLCCPEAARLVLSKTTPTLPDCSGEAEESDELADLRDRLISLVQDRSLPMSRRVDNLLSACSTSLPDLTLGQWADFLLELERLTPEWTGHLEALRDSWQTADFPGFDAHMTDRQTEYEQFTVYLLYRHFAKACDAFDAAARGAFAAWGYVLLRALGAVQFTQTGRFSFQDQVELVRLFSSELEYSEDNLDSIFDELY